MDNITIRKENTRLNTKTLGEAFNVSQAKDGTTNNYKYKLYRDKHAKDGDPYLTVIVNDTYFGFTVVGSIRKWWFGNKLASMDFDFINFCICIETLAKKLKVPAEDFWYSKVTKLEIGGNVKLPRRYENIIPNMISYPRLTDTNHGKGTKKFVSQNYQLIAYDKGKELYRHNIIDKSLLDKINEALLIMRFEVKLIKPSGTVLKGYVNSLQNIKENWDFIIDYWERCFQRIQIINVQGSALGMGSYTRTRYKNYLSAVVAKQFGIGFILNEIDLFQGYKKKSREKSHFKNLLKTFESSEDSDMQNKVLEAVNRKALMMKKRC